MKKHKIVIAIVLVAVLLVSLAACGNSGKPASDTNTKTEESSSNTGTGSATNSNKDTSTPAETYVMRLACTSSGEHPPNMWAEQFEIALEEATGGQIDVQFYPAGQLGTMAELIQGLKDGSVDATIIPSMFFSSIFPEASAIELPFEFKDSTQLFRILNNNETLYRQAYVDNGFIPAAWLLIYERYVLSAKKIESMKDFKGLVTWSAPGIVTQKQLELLGCTTSSIDVGEVSTSMQSGTLQAIITDISLMNSQSLYKSAPYFLNAPGDAMTIPFIISKLSWDKYPPELQETILKVANETVTGFEYDYTIEKRAEFMQKMQDGGMEIVELSDDFRNDMKAALSEEHTWYLDKFPQAKPIYDELQNLIAADNKNNG